MQVHPFGAFGGDDEIFLDSTFLWWVVCYVEAKAKSVEFVLEFGIIDVPIHSQFARFTFDFAVCTDLAIKRP